MTLKEHFLQEGRLEGRQEGRLEGRQEGRLEGQQKGRIEGCQQAILKLLVLRFKEVPEGLVEAIHEISEEPHLDRLLETAATCLSIEAFALEL